jgi:hypothetical protein
MDPDVQKVLMALEFGPWPYREFPDEPCPDMPEERASAALTTALDQGWLEGVSHEDDPKSLVLNVSEAGRAALTRSAQ